MNVVSFFIRRILGLAHLPKPEGPHAPGKRKTHPDYTPGNPDGHGQGKKRPKPFSRI